MIKAKNCDHFPDKPASPRARTCEEGEECDYGIRVCLECGYTGCCDSCAKHARAHAEKTGHQVMASFPADKDSFIWCYAHDDYLEPDEKRNLDNR